MIVRVKLLVYDVWAVEEYKTGFLSVGVDIFYQLYLKEKTNFLAHGDNGYYKTNIR